MSERKKWGLTFLLSALPLLGFWSYGLFDLDEGYYAAVVAEMNRRGEWITPFYAGHPWFEKPIFLYWMAKPSVLLFGQTVGPRLPSVFSTVALFGLCGWYLSRRVSPRAGRFCMLVLASSLLLVGLGRMMMTDPLLVLSMTAAFITFYESIVGNQRWRLATAVCLGLTVLTKGPVALPICLAVLIWTAWKEREFRPKLTKWWIVGTAVMLATIATWYVPAYVANGQVFVQQFLIEQNLNRFTGGDEAHRVPFLLGLIYYPLILGVGMLPWSLPIAKLWPASLVDASDPLKRYLGRWGLVILVFFTISGTKLPHYIVPAIPPLAMLLAINLAQLGELPWRRALIALIAVFVLVNAAFLLWFYRFSDHADLDRVAAGLNALPHRQGQAVEVFTYQFPRQDNKPRHGALNETSHPSLRFYLDPARVALLETDDWRVVVGHGHDENSVYVVTRPGRIVLAEQELARGAGVLLVREADLSNGSFEVYRLGAKGVD